MREQEIIYKNNKPYGIRDEGGFLLFFTNIRKFNDQEERYREEVESQYKLANKILENLKSV